MRRPSIFKKTDVTRAARAVLAAGLQIARIEVATDGAISVIPGKPTEAQDTSVENEWDTVHGKLPPALRS